jgi:hypothetical protein
MSKSQDVSDDRVLGQLEAQGRPWQDYFLLGDPAVICSGGKDGIAALVIEDEALASAALDFLSRRGARRFKDFHELKASTGWDGSARPQDVK